jgi:hypothetical protein
MSLNRLFIAMCLCIVSGYVNAASLVQDKAMPCAKPLTPWQLLESLKTAVKSNKPEDFACLFNLAVDVEFNKADWLTRKEQFSEVYPEVVKSGFTLFLEGASRKNAKIDESSNTIIIANRLAIKYGGSERFGYRVIKIDDLQKPNEFKYSDIHSELEFHVWYSKFQKAIELDQKAAVARMVCYPIVVTWIDDKFNVKNRTIHTETQFLQEYDQIITSHTKQVIEALHWPNLFNNSDGITLGQGDIQIISNGLSECIESVENGPGMEKMDAQAQAAAKAKHDSLPPYSYR